jgi:hypothetical protein
MKERKMIEFPQSLLAVGTVVLSLRSRCHIYSIYNLAHRQRRRTQEFSTFGIFCGLIIRYYRAGKTAL